MHYSAGLPDCRSTEQSGFAEACRIASRCDAVVLFLGEDAGLSGEAHSRAFLNLPGAQQELVRAVSASNQSVIAVVMAGRPLLLDELAEEVKAILYAWHPGTMGGPALADLLLGKAVPSGKLPVSFPRAVGQIPLYYAHKNTGRPPAPGCRTVPTGTPLNPDTFCSTYLDVDHRPLYPFGYGLSYSGFAYTNLTLSTAALRLGESLQATVTLSNTGTLAAEEVVQLYLRDLVGSVTRPVKELKDFCRIHLAPGESRQVTFTLHTDQLAFHNAAMQHVVEPGAFHLMIGGNSDDVLTAEFSVVSNS